MERTAGQWEQGWDRDGVKGKRMWMETSPLPSLHPSQPAWTGPAMHPLCASGYPARSSIHQLSASSWILEPRVQKGSGQDPRYHQGHTELTQPYLTVPQHPACPFTTVRGAEHQQPSPVCGRDRADPLLKHQRCSKFFNLPNRSISNYHVSHS